MKVYAQIANDLYIRDQLEYINPAWIALANDRLADICNNYLPSGSGFDSAPAIDYEGDPRHGYTISAAYHMMDEHGAYSGWLEFTIHITAKADLVSPWDFQILAPGATQSERDSHLDYIADTYAEALNKEYTHG